MSDKADTGGQAFPLPGTEQGHIPDGTWNQTYEPPTEGMTLLDAAALAVLPTILESHFKHNDEPNLDLIAQIAYDQAKGFIAEKRRREV